MNYVKLSLYVALMCLLALIEMIFAATTGLNYIVAIIITIVLIGIFVLIVREIIKGRKNKS